MKLIQSANIYAANHETFEQIPRVEPYLYMYLSHTLIAALITENDASIYFFHLPAHLPKITYARSPLSNRLLRIF